LSSLDLTDVEQITRITEAFWSVKRFAEIYLPHHLVDEQTGEHIPFGPHHLELFDLVEEEKADKRILRAEPREHGKSTIFDLIVVLWWLATRRKHFVLLVGDTSSQAEGHLHSVISELEENALLLEDFAHLRPKMDRKGQFVKWTDREIILETDQIVMAAGAGKSLRGVKRKQHRPDAIIVDDLENDEHVATKAQRDKQENWFLRALLNLLAKGGDFYYTGTILHHDSVMMRVIKSEKARREFGEPEVWDTKVVPAEDEEGKPLWPGMWPKERLEAKKREIGSIAYAQEFLNDPSKREGKLFKEEWANHYPLGKRPDGLDEYMGIDPSAGEKEQSDYIGIAQVGVDSQGRFFPGRVIETKITFKQMVDTLIALGEHIRPVKIAIETNFFQKVLKQEVDRRNREERKYLPFSEQRTIRDKVTRFLSLSALVEAGLLWLEEDNPEHAKLLNQMLEFPDGAHDDLIDAFDFAVQAARHPVAGHFTDSGKATQKKPVAAGMRNARF
jgi:predicted phage terminase large subunit-like protein